MKNIPQFVVLVFAATFIGGCNGWNATAHAQSDSSGRFYAQPIVDDEKMDIYLLTDKENGREALVNSRGGLIECGNAKTTK